MRAVAQARRSRTSIGANPLRAPENGMLEILLWIAQRYSAAPVSSAVTAAGRTSS
jgi:hypothetical protein